MTRKRVILAGALAGLVVLAGLVLMGFWVSRGLPDPSMKVYIMQGDSMAPTVPEGTRLLTRPFVRGGPLSRGKIVVHEWSEGRLLVKRVVALGGDRVSVENGGVYLNGQRLEEPYAVSPTPGKLPALTIPADHVWVLGDNRPMSLDSRAFGPIPLDTVRAVVIAP